jgi:2-amino-4-hydroxy-6-hydroxymethyldihydropteridine diphosphokinase
MGSNINPGDNVREALRRLSRVVRILRISTVYMTEPLGRPEQSPYYNCVIVIQTRREPLVLKGQVLRRIEEGLGRERSEDKYAPRTIDLDLILYDDLVLKTDDLTLPDPQILQRPFLALPLQELEPALVIPGSGLSIEEVAAALPHNGMKPLTRYTELLRKEFCHECGHEND